MNINLDAIIKQYDFNLAYAKELVRDLSNEQMTIVPSAGFENHPAFTLGHLVSGSAMLLEDMGAAFEMRNDWVEIFARKGPRDQTRPDNVVSKYPTKELLLTALEAEHTKVKERLKAMTEENLMANVKWHFDKIMPTLLDLIYFMCITHEAMHLGQLSAWRRAMGLPSALAVLKF